MAGEEQDQRILREGRHLLLQLGSAVVVAAADLQGEIRIAGIIGEVQKGLPLRLPGLAAVADCEHLLRVRKQGEGKGQGLGDVGALQVPGEVVAGCRLLPLLHVLHAVKDDREVRKEILPVVHHKAKRLIVRHEDAAVALLRQEVFHMACKELVVPQGVVLEKVHVHNVELEAAGIAGREHAIDLVLVVDRGGVIGGEKEHLFRAALSAPSAGAGVVVGHVGLGDRGRGDDAAALLHRLGEPDLAD